MLRLEVLLEPGFRIFLHHFDSQSIETFPKRLQNQIPRNRVPGVEVHRRKHRFQGIGEDGIASVAPGSHFAGTEIEVGPELHFARPASQGIFAHQHCAQPTELSLVGLGKLRVERLRYHEVQDSVAEKLEPLVVGTPSGPVSQRQFQQAIVAELMTQRSSQPPRVPSRDYFNSYFSLNVTSTSTLATMFSLFS